MLRLGGRVMGRYAEDAKDAFGTGRWKEEYRRSFSLYDEDAVCFERSVCSGCEKNRSHEGCKGQFHTGGTVPGHYWEHSGGFLQ